jgi:hypothetical protein
MSGQTISDVVSLVIVHMLERDTLADRVHAYVVQWVNSSPPIDVDPGLWDLDDLPLPCTDFIFSSVLMSFLQQMHRYRLFYQVRERPIPTAFKQPDERMTQPMLDTLSIWLSRHRYSTEQTLVDLGLTVQASLWFISKPKTRKEQTFVSLILAVVFKQVDIDCSIGVWKVVFDISWCMVQRVRMERVYTLTDREQEAVLSNEMNDSHRQAVLAQALLEKRKRIHPESF